MGGSAKKIFIVCIYSRKLEKRHIIASFFIRAIHVKYSKLENKANLILAQSAAVAEYADCISAEG